MPQMPSFSGCPQKPSVEGLVERECSSAYETCSMHMQGPDACVRSGSIKGEVKSPACLQQKESHYDKDGILLMS